MGRGSSFGIRGGSGSVDVFFDSATAAMDGFQSAADKQLTAFNAAGFGASPSASSSVNAVAIQSALNFAAAAGGGIVSLPAGTYPINAFLSITASNVKLVGSGSGATVLQMDASFVDANAAAISVYNPVFGTSQPLSFDTALGDSFVTLATAGNASQFNSGDWVLVRSLKVADTESPTNKFCGEMQQVQTADATTGVLTFYGSIADTYTVAQSASVIKVSALYNVRVADIGVQHAAASAPLIGQPAVLMRYCINSFVDRVEVRDVFNTGIEMWSCVQSAITDSRVSNVQAGSTNTVYYGIWVSGASKQVTVARCNFIKTRHSVTHGTHTNTGSGVLSSDAREGVQRNILILDCHSQASTTAHYDVHQPADGVRFVNCTAIGIWPTGAPDTTQWKGSVYGFQSRAKRITFDGCLVEQTNGGALVFGTGVLDNEFIGCTIRNIFEAGIITQLNGAITSGASTIALRDATALSASGSVTITGSTVTYTSIIGNVLQGCSGAPTAATGAGVYQLTAGSGNGIEMDTTCTGAGILIEGCEIIETAASAVRGQGNQNRVAVIGNLCRFNSQLGAFGSVQFGGTSDRISVEGNRIEENQNSRPVSISGGNNHRIINNYFYANNSNISPSWVGSNTIVYGNKGYTPGTLASPFATLALATAWVAGTVYATGATVSNNGNNYIAISGGTAAGSGGPSGTATGNIVDNTVIWKFLYPGAITSWAASTAVTKGTLRSNAGRVYECLADGTTDVASAGGPVGNSLTSSIVDNTTSWRYQYEGSELFANLSGGSVAPPSTYIQVVRSGPCTLTIINGTVTAIIVNGTTLASAATNFMFKLGIGDTFSVTYSVAPTFKVVYE